MRFMMIQNILSYSCPRSQRSFCTSGRASRVPVAGHATQLCARRYTTSKICARACVKGSPACDVPFLLELLSGTAEAVNVTEDLRLFALRSSERRRDYIGTAKTAPAEDIVQERKKSLTPTTTGRSTRQVQVSIRLPGERHERLIQ